MSSQEKLFNQRLGIRICLWREERRVTQGELAKAIGLTRTAVVKLEQGNHRISFYQLTLISKALKVNLSKLTRP